jgi:glucans biosynthesis protein
MGAILCVLTLAPSGEAHAFGLEDVAQRAKQLAGSTFNRPPIALPPELQNLQYEQYREIRMRPERTLWRGSKLPFEVGLAHPGWHFSQPVRISEITAEGVREIRFNPEDFDYGANKVDPQRLKDLSFAGLRIYYPMVNGDHKDEVLMFLGASYFRAVGRGQLYGAFARGLAVDTGLMSGEEFPGFVEFWIERPAPGAKELVIYALLDSKSLSGAYRFVLKPGDDTVMEVRAQLFLRGKPGKIGLAPLTAMFFTGENHRVAPEDYRPELHTSDGLLVQAVTGEWIWRPLVNPKRLLVTSYSLTNPVGFGLMQRDTNFASYQDLEGRYELRPSVWVRPKGEWGAGRVELVQIPTPDETNDNIVAYWVPDHAPQPEQPYSFEYQLTWQRNGGTQPPISWVVQSRRGYPAGRKTEAGNASFRVDFDGAALRKLPPEARLEGVVTADSNGEVLANEITRNDALGGWRLMFRVRRVDPTKPVELRAYLRDRGNALSEIWSYIIPPD